MMRFIVLLSIAAAAVLADPVPKYRRQNDTTPASPCAQVSMSSAAAMRSNAIGSLAQTAIRLHEAEMMRF